MNITVNGWPLYTDSVPVMRWVIKPGLRQHQQDLLPPPRKPPLALQCPHAAFRLSLGFYTLTSRTKVRYLVYLTSILSENFNIFLNIISPGTLAGQNQPGRTAPYDIIYFGTCVVRTTLGPHLPHILHSVIPNQLLHAGNSLAAITSSFTYWQIARPCQQPHPLWLHHNINSPQHYWNIS